MSSGFRVMVIGAHPDDCEVKCAGIAAKWAQAGMQVCFCSVTNGQSGHHLHAPQDLAVIRRREAAAAAAVIDVESVILDEPDGYLMPSLEARAKLITAIRDFRPDLIITHRPNDYHPDHRYTSQLVQDAAFTVQVPHIIPDAAAMDFNPVIAYMGDHFQKPQAFSADVIVEVDSVLGEKLAVLNEHKSQFYEWMPHLSGYDVAVPASEEQRREWLLAFYGEQLRYSTNTFTDALQRYYPERASSITYTEAFEGCEYGSPLTQTQIDRFFGDFL